MEIMNSTIRQIKLLQIMSGSLSRRQLFATSESLTNSYEGEMPYGNPS